jgi:hypothetical protein
MESKKQKMTYVESSTSSDNDELDFDIEYDLTTSDSEFSIPVDSLSTDETEYLTEDEITYNESEFDIDDDSFYDDDSEYTEVITEL